MDSRIRLYFFALMVISVAFVGTNLLSADQYSWKSDEGHYHHYISSFAKEGFGSFPKLLHSYWQDEKAQWYPPPTRLGYIIPLGYLYRLWPSMELLGMFSFLCYIASICVTAFFSRRLFQDKIIGYALTALIATSPLLMAMSRRALIESLLFLLWSSLLWLCTDYAIHKNRKHILGICFLFIWCLLVKESAVVLGPFILYSCWLGRDGSAWPWKAWISVAVSGVVGLLLIPGLIVGFEPWISSMTSLFFLQKGVFTINPYVIKYCQGPWFRYIVDAILLSPLITLMALGYAGHLFLKKENSKLPLLWVFFFVSVYVPLVFLQKNIRYVIPLELVYCLFAVLGIGVFAERFTNLIIRNRIWMGLVSLIIVYNWMTFYNIFVLYGLLDPISFHLLRLEKFIP